MIEALSPDQRRILKNVILGFGSVMLVLLASGAVGIAYLSSRPARLRTVMSSLFDTLEAEVERSFSSAVSPAERAEFEAAREKVRRAFLAGRMSSERVDRLRRRLLFESRRGVLEGPDVRSLTQFLNSLGAEAPPAHAPAAAA